MRRSSFADAAIPFLLTGAVVFALLRVAYESLPPLGWYIAVPLIFLAVAEVWMARRIRAAVRHRPGVKPVTALAIARSVALAKASVLVGAGMAGAAAGLVLHVIPDVADVSAAKHDLWAGLVAMVGGVAVTAAGYFLERAAVDPTPRGPHSDR